MQDNNRMDRKNIDIDIAQPYNVFFFFFFYHTRENAEWEKKIQCTMKSSMQARVDMGETRERNAYSYETKTGQRGGHELKSKRNIDDTSPVLDIEMLICHIKFSSK